MSPIFAELIITAGGENIAPVPIEDAIKEEVSIISNAMVIGDKKKFLSCFLTLKVNVCFGTFPHSWLLAVLCADPEFRVAPQTACLCTRLDFVIKPVAVRYNRHNVRSDFASVY